MSGVVDREALAETLYELGPPDTREDWWHRYADAVLAADLVRDEAEVKAEARQEFVQELIRGWQGGSGHTDNNKWVSVAQLKDALAHDPRP